MADHFWLSDAQWAVIEPHIPKVYTGKRRMDDRRVISGGAEMTSSSRLSGRPAR